MQKSATGKLHFQSLHKCVIQRGRVRAGYSLSGDRDSGDVAYWHESDEPITAGYVRSLG
jgi:hypothetical protein